MQLKLFRVSPKFEVLGLARQLHREFPTDEFVVVGVLDACCFLVPDFVREIKLLGQSIYGVGFYTAKSRQGVKKVQLSDVHYTSYSTTPLEGKSVVLLDVVCGSGDTIRAVRKDILEVQKAKSVFTAALFVADDLKVRAEIDNQPVVVPLGKYLVGYGLDLSGRLRELNNVYELIDDRNPDSIEFL